MKDRNNEDATSFVGRTQELAELADRFRGGSRLVTITGPGGVGKTRLALRFSRTPAIDGTVEGVCVCDLSDASSEEELCGVVARELGATLASHRNEDVVKGLGELFAAQGAMLFVLDNFEHLVPHARSTVHEWMRMSPRTRFLVTSRERLRLEGEQVFTLDPLPAPPADANVHTIASYDSVQLFVDRARAVRSEFALNSANAKPIAELIRRLDGLPLAIELAAARIGVMSVSKLLEAVPGEIDVLSDPRRGNGRQASMRATLDWSWNLLSEWERAAIAQVSVFRGGFFLDAAEAVLDLDAYEDAPKGVTAVLDILQALHDKSMLRSEALSEFDEFRYALYGPVREYAAERLRERDDAAAVQQRHSDHYTGFPTYWISPSVEEFKRIAAERHNLLAVYERELEAGQPSKALDAVMQLEWHFALQGPHDYYLRLLQRAVDEAERGLDNAQHARAQRCLGHAYLRVGHEALAMECWKRAIGFGTEASDPAITAASWIALATRQFSRAQLAEAQDSYRQASELVRRAEIPQLDWAFARLQAARLITEGEPERAQEVLLRLVSTARDSKSVFNEMTALLELGGYLLQVDRPRDARHYLNKCLDLTRQYPLAPHTPIAQLYMGQACADQGRRREAELHFQSSVDAARQAGNKRYAAAACGQLAALAVEEGNLERGLELVHEAVREFKAVQDHRGAGYWIAIHACIEAMRGDFARASDLLRDVEQELRSVDGQLDSRALQVFHAVVDLARANEMASDGQEDAAAALFEEIRPHFGAATEADASEEVRMGGRILKSYWDRTGRTPWAQHHRALEIAAAGSWFRLDGERVELGRRKALRAALTALAECAQNEPGAVLTAEELFEAGWPGQVARRDSMKNRVYVTVNALRKVGLQRVLQTHEGGYRLDPAVRISIAES